MAMEHPATEPPPVRAALAGDATLKI